MRKLQKLSALLLALALSFGLAVTAYAHDVPDMSRKGSITITFDLPAGLASYGSLTLYRVGDVHEDDGNYSFVPVDELPEAEFSFEDIHSPELAKQLAAYIGTHPMSGTTRIIRRTDGIASVTYSTLELGLYLAVQNRAASGYEKLAPFLISVPYMEDGVYVYEVTARAKSELEKIPETIPHTEPKLPQTGQLNWPVPVLAAVGLLLFAAGWLLYFGKGKPHEK